MKTVIPPIVSGTFLAFAWYGRQRSRFAVKQW